MRIETAIKLVFYGMVIAAFYATFARLAHGGADIPPQWGGYYPPPVVRNNCLETYTRSKQFRCDRIWANGFGEQQ
jgi:hypothetical protein